MTDDEQKLRAAMSRDPSGPAFLALGELLFARGDADAAAAALEEGLAHAEHHGRTPAQHLDEARELLALATRNRRGNTHLLEGLRAAVVESPTVAPRPPGPSILASTPPPPRLTKPPPFRPTGGRTAVPEIPDTLPDASAHRPSATFAQPAPLPEVPLQVSPPSSPSPPASARLPAKHVPMPTPQDVVGLAARPRVIDTQKPKDAATAALHTSASMGHDHLPAMLRAGLMHVPGIALPPSTLVERRRLRAHRRWVVRAAVVMSLLSIVVAILVVVRIAKGRERDAAARALRTLTDIALIAGSYDALVDAETKIAALVADDPRVPNIAAMMRVRAARAVLFGVPAPDAPVSEGEAPEIKEARAMVTLAQSLAGGEGDAAAYEALVGSKQPFAQWLRTRFEATRDAAAAIERMEGLSATIPLAAISRAGLLLDAGALADGEKVLDDLEAEALRKHSDVTSDKLPDQALIWAERAILRAERGVDVAAAFDILNVKLDRDLGPLIANVRWYAQGYASLMLDDFSGAEVAVAKLKAPYEPRLRARIGLLQILLGDVVSARELFSQLPTTDKSTLASELRAAIALTKGRPGEALEALGSVVTVRAEILRAQALIDARAFPKAAARLESLRQRATDSLEVEVYYQQATFLAASAAADTSELERVSRRSKSKLGRHALALALVWKGRCDEAERQMKRATEDISPEEPNPLLYRSWAGFAEQRLCVGDAAGARQYAQKALELVDWYEPAAAIAAAAAVALGDRKAKDALLAFEAAPEVLCGLCEVTLAKALVPDPKIATQSELDRADRALRRAEAKGAAADALVVRGQLGLAR